MVVVRLAGCVVCFGCDVGFVVGCVGIWWLGFWRGCLVLFLYFCFWLVCGVCVLVWLGVGFCWFCVGFGLVVLWCGC